jgi:hypothetical protein
LGVSTEAIRGRIRRGTIRHERAGGRVYVVLDERPINDQPSDHTTELINTLQEQLQAERAAHAEARRLLAAALERIPPAIEPPGGPTEATEQREYPEPTPKDTQGVGQVAPPGPRRLVLYTLWTLATVVPGLASFVVFVWEDMLSTGPGSGGVTGPFLYLVLPTLALPAVFGFWYGGYYREHRETLFRRNLLIGAITGLGSSVTQVFTLLLFTYGVLGEVSVQDVGLAGTFGPPPVLRTFLSTFFFFVFAALLRQARQPSRDASGVPASPPAPQGPVGGWTPRQQAMVGLIGTIITALFTFLGVLVEVLFANGGNGG